MNWLIMVDWRKKWEFRWTENGIDLKLDTMDDFGHWLS